MRDDRKRLGILVLALGLLGCGGSLNRPDGATSDTCASLGACACMAASNRCTPVAEACWCPSECNPNIACICGGGRFLACQPNDLVATCTEWLSSVQSQCAGEPFVQYIGELCTTANPICVSSCLANLKNFGQCSEIDCSFCPVCDCAPPAVQSPFAACVASCRAPPPPER